MKYKDYDDYDIHPDGSVVSYKGKEPRVMKPGLDGNGYPVVTLCKDNTKKTFTVHRLVAECFIPNPENKRTVNHKDHDRTNNHVDNLEMATHKEQSKHRDESEFNIKGENHGRHKLTETEVLEIRRKYATGKYTLKGLAKEYNVTFPTIQKVVNRENWKHI